MKKILLATSGLFGAALLSAAAHAETPKVTLGGFSDFQAGFTSDDRDDTTRGTGFRNDNEISVRVDGTTAGGLGYGAVIDLEADTTNDADGQGTNAARTFTYLSGNWGKVEMGDNKGAAATGRVDASTLAAATGGINGAWTNFANTGASAAPAVGTSLANSGGFISAAKGYAEHGSTTVLGDENLYNATKISYYSPRFAGFQLGASFTPDLENRGQNDNLAFRNNVTQGNMGEIFDVSLGYENQFANGVKLAASGTYENGDADRTAAGATVEDLKAYSLGALVGYQGFSVAGSYGNWGDSGRATGGSNDDSTYWTAGAGYEAGPFALSATYLDSTRETGVNSENEFKNLVLGADYKLAPGITPYAEVSFYEFDQQGTGAVFDNDGTAFILGTQVAF
jgi:outer membrane protein OmpU